MFNFTCQERKAILFFVALVLIGLGIKFALKVNPRVEKFISLDSGITETDINSAGYEDLINIKGITPRLAKNIIEYRDKYGPFRRLEELKEVKGIGEFRFDKIKDYLDVK